MRDTGKSWVTLAACDAREGSSRVWGEVSEVDGQVGGGGRRGADRMDRHAVHAIGTGRCRRWCLCMHDADSDDLGCSLCIQGHWHLHIPWVALAHVLCTSGGWGWSGKGGKAGVLSSQVKADMCINTRRREMQVPASLCVLLGRRGAGVQVELVHRAGDD